MITNQTNRRDFIKSFSLYTGGAMVAGIFPWSTYLKAQAPGNNRIAKIGLIGYGSRGNLLFQVMKEAPGYEWAAICDIYEPHLDKARELTENKIKYFKDYRKLLELQDLDAVIIATPLFEHYHMVMDALDAGKHVFCEKSMAMTPEQCKNMVIKQQETGKILLIGHQRLFSPKYHRAMEMIHAGQIGSLTQIRAFWHRNRDWRRPVPSPELERFINWRLYHEYSRGLMTELASHQIQVATWALQEYPDEVMGSGSIVFWNDGREVYDNVNLVYTFPSGVHLIYDSNTANKHYGLEEQIMGNTGTIEPELGKFFTEAPPPAPGILQLINQLEKDLFDNVPIGGASWVPDEPSKYQGEYLLEEEMKVDGTGLQMRAFVEMVANNDTSNIPFLLQEAYYASVASLLGWEAMQSMKIIKWPEELKIKLV